MGASCCIFSYSNSQTNQNQAVAFELGARLAAVVSCVQTIELDGYAHIRELPHSAGRKPGEALLSSSSRVPFQSMTNKEQKRRRIE